MASRKKVQYQKAYYDNEADANKAMSKVNGAAGILALVIWVLYLTKIFTIPDQFFPVVCVLFPTAAVLLFVPLFLMRTDAIRKPGYKYFILFSLMAVIIALNITVPKHSLLFWPFAILIANHYYNPTIGRVIYGVSMVAMLICMYLGMFFGEFDENLFGGGVIKPDGTIGTVETVQERLDLLADLARNGNNRYLKVFLYYYFPRAAIVTLFFMVSNLLNQRTYKLLDDEIRAHDEQEKAKTELGVARDIQMNTLPAETISSDDVELVAELKAAKEVGGDLYDYVDIDEDHVAVLIGDVSGKGVPAAMFMMKTITSFRDFATSGKTPSEILREINSSISKGNKAGMFVTAFLAILDKRNGKIVYANAGHNPPIVGSDFNYRYLKCNAGLLLGCFPQCYVKDEEITLQAGESITLYTDGITEARDSAGNFFGEGRLLETMNRKDHHFVVELHHAIKDEISSFVKEAPQSDDITLVTLKYRGDHYLTKEKGFSAKKENVLAMLSFINDFGDQCGLPDDFKNKLAIVGDEILSNIIHHGYGNAGGDIFVRLIFDQEKKEFVLTVIDHAKPFNQLEVDNAPVTGTENKIQVGGLGLIIVKKIMTECAYDRINGKNILVLKKRFDEEKAPC
ncbi:MAG: SpoIIE family protein phosphatase [Bacilli bacterium]|nr:SpoIIE family protein phosphatase [Bacilli bacterium]